MPPEELVDKSTQAVTDDSATSTDPQVDESTIAADTDDASAASDDSSQTTDATDDTVAVQGSEPADEPKAVKELKAQRKKRQEAERQAEYWRAVAEGRVQKPDQPATDTPPDGAPVVTAFENYEDYLVAKAKYELRKENESQTVQQRAQAVHNTFISKLNEEVETNPDSDIIEIATDLGTKVSPQLGWLIKESDIPTGMVRYLYDHPAEVNRLNSLSPTSAAREIGKIEAKILNPPRLDTKKVSSAPPPIKPVKATGPVEFDDETCSMDEYYKRRNEAKGLVTRR